MGGEVLIEKRKKECEELFKIIYRKHGKEIEVRPATMVPKTEVLRYAK